MKEPVVSVDRRKQSIVVAELVSLLIQSACLFLQVADPLVLVGALWWNQCSRIGEMLCGFPIPQSGECNVTAPG